jgi:hypothetical protein
MAVMKQMNTGQQRRSSVNHFYLREISGLRVIDRQRDEVNQERSFSSSQICQFRTVRDSESECCVRRENRYNEWLC